MPIRFTTGDAVSGKAYQSVFVGPTDHTVAITLTLSGLTNKEIDADGYLKPGIPFNKAGTLVTAGAVFGVTIEEVKVAANNETATIAALTTQQVALATIAQVNRKAAEDMLDRVYTAAEIAGFDAAGSKVVLIPYVA